jgi:hypothetical protein
MIYTARSVAGGSSYVGRTPLPLNNPGEVFLLMGVFAIAGLIIVKLTNRKGGT